MAKKDGKEVRFPHIDESKLDEIVRVIKYGMHHSTVLSDDVRNLLAKWVQEMEAEIHAAEHHAEGNPLITADWSGPDFERMQPDDGEPV